MPTGQPALPRAAAAATAPDDRLFLSHPPPQTWLNWTACGFSALLFFSVAFVYNASCATCYPPSNPYWTVQTLLGDPVFYLTCLLAPITALLPRWVSGMLPPSESSRSSGGIFTAVCHTVQVSESASEAKPRSSG